MTETNDKKAALEMIDEALEITLGLLGDMEDGEKQPPEVIASILGLVTSLGLALLRIRVEEQGTRAKTSECIFNGPEPQEK